MSAHPNRPPGQGDNSNHYSGPAELAGDGPAPAPHPLQSHPVNAPGLSPSQAQQNAPVELPSPLTPLSSTQPSQDPPPYSVSEEQQQQHFPPPPPGPPPAGQQQQYYPPPPPGPPPSDQKQQYYPPAPPGPPNQAHTSGEEHPDVPPPSYTDEHGSGAGFVDAKPPALPPRTASGQGQAASSSQAHQAAPLFQPPPKSPNLSKPSSEQSYEFLTPQSSYGNTTTATSTSPGKQTGGGFGQKLYQWGLKAGAPINKMTNRLGSESFWPTTMDKECDKAARILKSFCKDGFYATPSSHPPGAPGDSKASKPSKPSSGPASEPKVLVQIPRAAIANAAGLAIFTTFRAGLHISGAGGSGIVMARLPDGSWSPPSGFLVHTLGAGIMAGLDIYDCVCVLNTPAAVNAFTRPRLSLGGEVAVVAGPVGAGASVEAALGGGPRYNSGKGGEENNGGKGKGKGCSIEPVWSYMKSRGFYAGMQADGTIIVQRPDANAAFYGGERGLTVEKILSGQVRSSNGGAAQGDGGIVMWPQGARQLIEVLKVAEGKGADPNVISELGAQPTPGDLSAPVSPGLPPRDATATRKSEEGRAGTRYG